MLALNPDDLNAEYWGPRFWEVMYLAAVGFSKKPMDAERMGFKMFYEALQIVLPCSRCRVNLKAHLERFPLDAKALASRDSLFAWVHELHQAISEDLGKPPLPQLNQFKQNFIMAPPAAVPQRALPSSRPVAKPAAPKRAALNGGRPTMPGRPSAPVAPLRKAAPLRMMTTPISRVPGGVNAGIRRANQEAAAARLSAITDLRNQRASQRQNNTGTRQTGLIGGNPRVQTAMVPQGAIAGNRINTQQRPQTAPLTFSAAAHSSPSAPPVTHTGNAQPVQAALYKPAGCSCSARRKAIMAARAAAAGGQ